MSAPPDYLEYDLAKGQRFVVGGDPPTIPMMLLFRGRRREPKRYERRARRRNHMRKQFPISITAGGAEHTTTPGRKERESSRGGIVAMDERTRCRPNRCWGSWSWRWAWSEMSIGEERYREDDNRVVDS
jgi:hypothetical protein